MTLSRHQLPHSFTPVCGLVRLRASLLRSALFLLALGIVSVVPVAQSAPVTTPHTKVELLAENDAIIPGQPFWIAYRIHAAPGWHTYWRNPGDSGLPSELNLQLPDSWQLGELHWPTPELISTPPFATHAYHGEVLLLAQITPPAQIDFPTVTLAGQAAWLVCKELCLRETAPLSLTLTVAKTATAINQARFNKARSRWPRAHPDWQLSATRHGNETYLLINGPNPLPTPIHFFPYVGDQIEPAAPQRLEQTTEGHRLRLTVSQFSDQPFGELNGVIAATSSWDQQTSQPGLAVNTAILAASGVVADGTAVPNQFATTITTNPQQPLASTMGLGLALLLAFIGGAILNLMPCVFPILSIKVLAFIDMAQGHKGHVRRHGLLFGLGIVLSFWALGGLLLILKQAGAEIGWGFQLQSPGFVIALGLLLFVLALNLLGVFEIGGTAMRLAGNVDTGSGYWSSFATGILAAAVATPCTAPFMGAAMGYAIAQPAQVTMLVFTAVALGLASPYLLLAEVPGLLEKLPKPGQWMVTFRQLLAFPLLASAVWLGWVLGRQQGVDAQALLLITMTILAMAGWLHGLQQRRGQRRRWVDGLILALLLIQLPLWSQMTQANSSPQQAVAESGWEPFDTDQLAAYLAQGEPVFIDFTAAWCITCQVNKKLALNHPAVVRHFADNKIHKIRADWTRADPKITAALAAVGRNGVPTYLYYDRTGQAHLLPELLTVNVVIDALQ